MVQYSNVGYRKQIPVSNYSNLGYIISLINQISLDHYSAGGQLLLTNYSLLKWSVGQIKVNYSYEGYCE